MRRFAVLLVIMMGLPCWAQTYTLTVNAANGTVTLDPAGGSYSANTVVRLIPRPNVGYSFSAWSGDLVSKRLAPTVVMTANKTITANFVTWVAPMGIPAPSFGITETYRYYDVEGNRSGDLTYQASAGGGFFTHYVDNSDPASTDTANPYGSIAVPRKTIPINPTAIPAGSVVEIHGGPYSSRYGWDVKCTGTAALPIFIRGSDATQANFPHFDGSPWTTSADGYGMRVSGSYVIVENLEFYQCYLQVVDRSAYVGLYSNNHICFRNLHSYGRGQLDRYDGISIWGLAACPATDCVLYACESHHHGLTADTSESDVVNVTLGNTSSNIWVIDNHLYEAQSDSVQATCTTTEANHIYVGRNVMHTDGENAVDIKAGSDFIFSQNAMFDHFPVDSPYGDSTMVFHTQQRPGDLGCLRTWVIFNEISDAKYGVACSTNTRSIYVVGNVFHNLTSSAITCANGVTYAVIGNTIAKSTDGIGFSTSTSAVIANNIVSLAANSAYLSVYGPMAAASTCKNNLFYYNGAAVKLRWNTTWYDGVAAFEAASGASGDLETEPSFTSADTNDFHTPTGPGVNAGIKSDEVATVYDLFESTYGLSIRRDFDGAILPQTGDYDMGAYEVTAEEGDATAPGDITGFAATRGDHQVALAWANPAAADFAGVLIVRKAGGVPSDRTDGTVAYQGTGTSHTDTGLTNNTTYCYKAWTYDSVPNYSTGVVTAGTPTSPWRSLIFKR